MRKGLEQQQNDSSCMHCRKEKEIIVGNQSCEDCISEHVRGNHCGKRKRLSTAFLTAKETKKPKKREVYILVHVGNFGTHNRENVYVIPADKVNAFQLSYLENLEGAYSDLRHLREKPEETYRAEVYDYVAAIIGSESLETVQENVNEGDSPQACLRDYNKWSSFKQKSWEIFNEKLFEKPAHVKGVFCFNSTEY